MHFSSFSSSLLFHIVERKPRTFAFFYWVTYRNPLKFISRKNFLSPSESKTKEKSFLFSSTQFCLLFVFMLFVKCARNKRRKELREWWKMTLRGRKICNRHVSLFCLFWKNVSRMKELVTLALHGRSICRSEMIFISSLARSLFFQENIKSNSSLSAHQWKICCTKAMKNNYF